MNFGKSVFAQVMDFLPMHVFRRCVDRYQGNYKTTSFSCFDQFLCMAFAQLTYRESLRDIESCLRSMKSKLYHMGIRGKISRNTLAHANETRDWRIYADFAQSLISKARPLYSGDSFGVDLKNTVYALDATIIDLCLSTFPWAKKINPLCGLEAPLNYKYCLIYVGIFPPLCNLILREELMRVCWMTLSLSQGRFILWTEDTLILHVFID